MTPTTLDEALAILETQERLITLYELVIAEIDLRLAKLSVLPEDVEHLVELIQLLDRVKAEAPLAEKIRNAEDLLQGMLLIPGITAGESWVDKLIGRLKRR